MNKKKFLIIGLVILGVVGVGFGGYFVYTKFIREQESPAGVSTGVVLSIPNSITENKFGFLSGAPEEGRRIKEYGGKWARPHPGPFLWDAMQKSKDSEISFNKTDKLVKDFQKEEVGLLITLWPFADWDQKQRDNASDYQVSDNDEFLPKGGLFGERMDYLPRYRGNPVDWTAYEKWIKAVVERYDGDGQNDMPGLKMPIKYWEVMNEPDLTPPEEFGEDARLQFYTQDGKAYGELLIKTSKYIKDEDPDAQVLIAGAAGGNDRFLSFYKDVFSNTEAVKAFDIGNVHCISNDNYESFNVEPYKAFLESFAIDKPIWVTEAEAVVSDDPDINATQTLYSTRKALELGAKRIFFTRQKFIDRGDKPPPAPEDKPVDITPEISGKDAKKAYNIITSQD